MTIPYDSRPSALQRTNSTTRSPRARRWAVLASLSTAATIAVVGVTQFGDDSRGETPSRPLTATDYTRSQRLIQQSIDDAIANHNAADSTRSQRLIQQSIDDAIAAHG